MSSKVKKFTKDVTKQVNLPASSGDTAINKKWALLPMPNFY